MEDENFCFTKIYVKKVNKGKDISKEDYAKSLEEIKIIYAKADETLTS